MKGVVHLTEAAVTRIEELSGREPGKVLRLSARLGGCAGFKYALEYSDASQPGDEVVAAGASVLVVDGRSLVHLLGLRVDWVPTPAGMAFSYENPNQTSACGCGESFAC
mgnify:CR=1 FL=1